ncbi:MAG TPA: ATP-binding protein [Prolixibacteraceae bacterium]|nr:ATP-binding protein [Prolixibacteraceae bacterium]
MEKDNPFAKKIDSLNTEIEKLKKGLEESKQFNTTVFINLNHEIRTPLNGILGFSEVITDPSISESERSNYSDIIAESSNLLMSIISDVIDISKINSGIYRIYPVRFDLNDLMFQIYQKFKPEAEKKNLQLFLENVISSTKTISSDPAVIEKVLNKLIDNALKFTKQGWVKFYYKEEKEHIEFFVEDTGIGIPEDQRSTIFERFTKQPVSQSRKLGGTGIDLSLCHGLVGLLGGKISLLPAKKEGSIFRFTVARNF